MTAADLTRTRAGQLEWAPLAKRLAPTLVAAVFAAAYVIVSPPSLDLAAHLFRAQLFRVEGFGIWNNWWNPGDQIVGSSVLFPAVSAWMTPQLAGAIAATGTAALFEPLARRHFGPNAWIGAVVFGAGTAIDLYTGRLAFAFGALPALAAIVALDYELSWLAVLLALASALCSPVAALFAGLAASGYALGALVGSGACSLRCLASPWSSPPCCPSGSSRSRSRKGASSRSACRRWCRSCCSPRSRSRPHLASR